MGVNTCFVSINLEGSSVRNSVSSSFFFCLSQVVTATQLSLMPEDLRRVAAGRVRNELASQRRRERREGRSGDEEETGNQKWNEVRKKKENGSGQKPD